LCPTYPCAVPKYGKDPQKQAFVFNTRLSQLAHQPVSLNGLRSALAALPGNWLHSTQKGNCRQVENRQSTEAFGSVVPI
jgi:hypothetical protein